MPGMDDFDDILNALGAQPPPSVENVDGRDEQDMFPAALMPDLDAVPAAQSGAAATAPKTLGALGSEEDLLSELGPELNIDTHFSAPASTSAPIPTTTPVDLDGLPPGIDTVASPPIPPTPAYSEEAPVGELQETDTPEAGDTFSLDTAIGDIASESLDMERAPEPIVPDAPIPEEDALPVPPAPIADDLPDVSDLPVGPRFDEVDLNDLDALLDDMLASAPASGPGPAAPSPASEQETVVSGDSVAAGSGPELAPLRMDMETLRKVEDMELTLHNLDSRITALENRQNELYANIDKLAAEAAAKIIREELAALLKAGL
jgi:hypothetical protein